jgi:lactoylglutathione lyase
MQPINPDKSPKVHVPPLNHIGLWIDDLQAAYADLTARGVRFTPGGIRKGAGEGISLVEFTFVAGHDVAFIHPKGNDQFPIGSEGVLLELVQAPPSVIAAADAQVNSK